MFLALLATTALVAPDWGAAEARLGLRWSARVSGGGKHSASYAVSMWSWPHATVDYTAYHVVLLFRLLNATSIFSPLAWLLV